MWVLGLTDRTLALKSIPWALMGNILKSVFLALGDVTSTNYCVMGATITGNYFTQVSGTSLSNLHTDSVKFHKRDVERLLDIIQLRKHGYQRDHSQGHTANKLKKRKLNWGSIGPKSTARTRVSNVLKKSLDFKEHIISNSRLLLVKKKKTKSKIKLCLNYLDFKKLMVKRKKQEKEKEVGMNDNQWGTWLSWQTSPSI